MLQFRLLPYLLCLSLAVAQNEYDYESLIPSTTSDTFPVMDTDYDSVSVAVKNCPRKKIGFELVTGYVYSAPSAMLDSQPGTLMLTDCINMCRENGSCYSVNYETGLCVLFSSSADLNGGSLTKSQFPVFTIYAQKTCMKKTTDCNTSWNFERVPDMMLSGYTSKTVPARNKQECMDKCVETQEFNCRAANYDRTSKECFMSAMNRHTVAGTKAFVASEGMEFLESNCVLDPVRMCEFQKMEDKILKTVDAVYQEIVNQEECQNLCLAANFRCHSFDYGDTGDKVCRLSHHSTATLNHIEDPYLHIPNSSTYELSSCYNVTIDCRSGDMVTKIRTSKIFNGKIYAKDSPNSCVKDVDNSLEFSLSMSYNDVDCNIKKESASRYKTDVIIQHHDLIVTSADLALSVHCQYDLSNKSVTNEVDLAITGEIVPVFEEEMIVDSPNVVMVITDENGNDVDAAAVGDMLQLRIMIVDPTSPYEIFVRNLVAHDGYTNNQITLLDSDGCPTELEILRPLMKLDNTGKVLGSYFDAFKFPTSDKVQFRAMITPCIPTCEPVQCSVPGFGGQIQHMESHGRKKRDVSQASSKYQSLQEIVFLGGNHLDITAHGSVKKHHPITYRHKRETVIPDELLVERSIRISDRFGLKGSQKKSSGSANREDNQTTEEMVLSEDVSGLCINTMGLILACSLFLVAQVILIIVWTAIWQRRRHNKLDEPLSHTTTTESLRQLYDSGYPRRI